jgi:multidrug efflux system outer membrane protein
LTLGKTTLTTPPPVIPAGIPARVLERRPDIQSAAQMIAAANARIGAARAGYFPDISLSAIGGFASIELSDLFKKSNQFWSLGGLNGGQILTQPIFQGGLLSATLAERKAEYAGANASYRAAALQAFREVEDNLSGLRSLRDQAVARTSGLTAAKRAYAVASDRYKVGYSSQLEYLDAERNYLAAQRGAVQVLGQRYINTVQLVKALGGSWETPLATTAR